VPGNHEQGDRLLACFKAGPPRTLSPRPLGAGGLPGHHPQKNGAVTGLIYLDLPPESWPRLDAFEDKIYYRCPVKVILADGSTLAAETYVLRPEYLDHLGEKEWSYAEFLASARERFAKEYQHFPEPHCH